MAESAGLAVSVISLGIQVVQGLVDYYTACKDRKSDLDHTLKSLGHLLDILKLLDDQVKNRRFQPDEQSLRHRIESLIYDCEGVIDELQQETKKFTNTPSSSVWDAARAVGRRVAYPFRQSTLQKLEEDVDAICANLSLALQVLQQQDTSNIHDDIEDSKAILELLRADQISSEIQGWLKAPDASVNYNEACKKKHPRTGLWFVKSATFTTWLNTPNSFLWVNGFAGCGKSVLSSTIIQHTFRHKGSNPAIGIAFFYFTFNDESKQDTSAMLRALILQFVGQLKDQNSPLLDIYERYKTATPPDHAYLNCLRQVVRMFGHAYVVLDALDESPRQKHRGNLFQTLEDMRGWGEPGFHLLVTSRDEQDIREHLVPLDPDQDLPMRNEHIDEDIRSFVSSHLRNNRRLRKWERYYDEIEQALTEGAKGVFRWVECQFIALETCPGSKTRLDRLLKSLPRTLDDTYERIFLNIDEESAADAKRILTLLCTARRPLSVAELIDGIAVELGEDPQFNKDSRLMSADDIRHICPGLVEIGLRTYISPPSINIDIYDEVHEAKEVDENYNQVTGRIVHDLDDDDDDEIHEEDEMDEENEVGQDYNTATVRIAHYSVQEYLQSDRIRQSRAQNFSIEHAEANIDVACICLVYLMNPVLWSFVHSPLGRPTFRQRLVRKYPFAFYSASEWAYHYHQSSRAEARLHQLARLLFMETKAFESFKKIWKMETLNLDELGSFANGYAYYDKKFRTPITIASVLGLDRVVQALLDHYDRSDYGDALIAAAEYGHATVVSLLLDSGADANHESERDTPLRAACRRGHDNIAKALLDKGANVNHSVHKSLSGRSASPLESAVSTGRELLVELLLDAGADANVGIKRTPLEWAVYRGDLGMVERLLARGADANVGIRMTPLESAVYYEKADMIKLLLAKGGVANVGIQRTPLEWAVSMCSRDLGDTELMPAKMDGHVRTKRLHFTSLYDRDVGIVELLLSRSRDVNAGRMRTPLEWAVFNGNRGMVKLLLDGGGSGGNPNFGMEKTPLEWAVFNEDVGMVELLLSKGVEVNSQTGMERRLLKWWAKARREDTVQLLQDRAAERLHVNARVRDPKLHEK